MITEDLNLEVSLMQKIDELVTEYKRNADEVVFEAIYEMLKPTRQQAAVRLRRSLPTSFGEAEIQEIIDDSVMQCIFNFSAEKGCSFITFLCRDIEDLRKMRIRKLNAEKRKSNVDAVALDATVSDDSDTCIADMLVDTNATDPLENLQCSDIVNSLKAFMQTSHKNHIAGTIIAYDVSSFESREEKHAAIENLLGQKMTTSGIHKKIKRAKVAFKNYLENN